MSHTWRNDRCFQEYGSKGDGVHNFDAPEGVHTDEINRVFIADRKNDRIHILWAVDVNRKTAGFLSYEQFITDRNSSNRHCEYEYNVNGA